MYNFLSIMILNKNNFPIGKKLTNLLHNNVNTVSTIELYA
jgi:hypothetical protein